jgi:hypothetical protein
MPRAMAIPPLASLTAQFPVDFTIADIMTLEGFETARNLLGYNPNAYMFHVCLVCSAPHWQ